MVGLASTYHQREELEYWWRPKFNDDLTSISPNVTHHEATPEERMYHCISRTEFWWQSCDGKHIFEAEELRDLPSPPIAALRSRDDKRQRRMGSVPGPALLAFHYQEHFLALAIEWEVYT
jgi:hypothetical protein